MGNELTSNSYRINEITETQINQLLNDLKEQAKIATKELSDNYRQRVVYKLLNTIKVNDQKEFLWILLRTINDPKNDSYNKLTAQIDNIYTLPITEFEKWAYSIVLGIMSSRSESNE